MAKLSLLEKARNLPVRASKPRIYTIEEIELVEAWINNEIGISQLAKAAELKSQNAAYPYVAFVCKQMLSKNGKKK